VLRARSLRSLCAQGPWDLVVTSSSVVGRVSPVQNVGTALAEEGAHGVSMQISQRVAARCAWDVARRGGDQNETGVVSANMSTKTQRVSRTPLTSLLLLAALVACRSEVVADDYDRSCNSIEDCVAVHTGEFCPESDCHCPNTAINKRDVDKYKSDVADVTCGPEIYPISCKACADTVPCCADSLCGVIINDGDCDQTE
jgi:hypothetical protein